MACLFWGSDSNLRRSTDVLTARISPNPCVRCRVIIEHYRSGESNHARFTNDWILKQRNLSHANMPSALYRTASMVQDPNYLLGLRVPSGAIREMTGVSRQLEDLQL